jgi:hypothetical protein
MADKSGFMKIAGNKFLASVMMIFVVGCSLGDHEQTTESKDSVPALSSSRCELAPDAGPCEAYMIRYYFDPGRLRWCGAVPNDGRVPGLCWW